LARGATPSANYKVRKEEGKAVVVRNKWNEKVGSKKKQKLGTISLKITDTQKDCSFRKIEYTNV